MGKGYALVHILLNNNFDENMILNESFSENGDAMSYESKKMFWTGWKMNVHSLTEAL